MPRFSIAPPTAAIFNRLLQVFNTDAESPFAAFVPCRKQTGVFVDRFFHASSYEDLAVKYDMSPSNAQKTFHNAVKRVYEILSLMGSDRRVDLSQYKKRVEERSGKIPKGQKWFLLNKLFGISPSEIAEMEGMKESSSVRQLIIRVGDQLRAGEIRLIDATPDEAREAKKRLEEHRQKRRERYGKSAQCDD